MPHLSPMKWKLMALLIILLLTITTTSSWWSQLPSFKPATTSQTSTFSFPMWQWK